ncbi:polysaccharide deacetylase family protein [Congzhengia minquanensis]|uniref:Polysaccharide deacetylase family protein n=1 Tax=Congzhengia minquanensis TaxID=2763657 RepID=A0A926DLK9_9FIRM|nr:GDSL-type esterase/lipase family protein [Congzhengia minquanensis]MBC8539459.1 polysaccharide deacetylase family protein [Congzhengia minquanensis]
MIRKQLYLLLAIVFILPGLVLPAANAAPDETTKTWLVAGDSITSDFYCRGYKKYDDYLKYYFNIEQGNNFRFVKTAVPGFKVEDYLNNFDDMLGKYQAEIVSVFLGTNNKSDTEAVFTDKYRTLIEKIVPSTENVAVGVPENRKIILFTPIPMNSNGSIHKLTQISAGIKTVAEEMAAQGYDITHIDLSTVFDNIAYGTDENLPAFADYYEADAYHPNRFGQAEIAKAILKGLGVKDSSVLSLTPKQMNETQKKLDFKVDLKRGKKRADFTDINSKLTDLNNAFLSSLASAAYDSVLITGGSATAGAAASAGFCQTYPEFIRMKLRNDSRYQNKRVVDLSNSGQEAQAIAETIGAQFDAYPDVTCAIVMPEIPALYRGDRTGTPTVSEYKQAVAKIISAAKSRNIALMLLTPVPSAKRENNLLLEAFSEALIDAAEEAYVKDNGIKLCVANVFHVLKPIADVEYLSESYYDEQGFLKDSAHTLIYLAAMQETAVDLTNMRVSVPADTTLTATQTLTFLQNYYAEKAENAFSQVDFSQYGSNEQIQLADLAEKYLSEIRSGMVTYRIENAYEELLRELAGVKTKKGSAANVYFSAADGTVFISSPVDKTESIVIAVFHGDTLKDSFLIKNTTFKKGELYEFKTGLTVTETDEIKIIESCDLENSEIIPKTTATVSFQNRPATYSMLLPGGKTKAFTLSYDDALESDEKLVNMLDRYGVKGTFNVISGKLGGVQSGHNLLQMYDVKRVYQKHEASMHGYTHLPLRDENITAENIETEITKDRQRITTLTGIEPVGYAYPGGAGWNNAFVIEQLRKNNVLYARPVATTGDFTLPNDFLAWKMTCHHNSALSFVEPFLADGEDLRVFSVWGHTYELNESSPKSWNVMEELLTKVSDRNDVWYATNREIAEYTTSFRNLKQTGQGNAVYNPSDQDIYLKSNGKTVLVKANAIVPLEDSETCLNQTLSSAQTAVIIELLNKCTSAEVNADGILLITSPAGICGDVFIAAYDEQNRLVEGVVQKDVQIEANTPYHVDVTSLLSEEVKRLKILFIENLTTLRPIAEAVNVSVK